MQSKVTRDIETPRFSLICGITVKAQFITGVLFFEVHLRYGTKLNLIKV